MGSPSRFVNWPSWKLGFYPPTEVGRQGPYLQVLAENSEFFWQPWVFLREGSWTAPRRRPGAVRHVGVLFKCSQARAEASSRRWEEFPPTASSPFQDFTPSLALGPPQEPPLSAPAVDQRPRLVTVHWRQLPTWASPVSCSLKLRLTHRTSASSHFSTLNSLSTVVFGGEFVRSVVGQWAGSPPGASPGLVVTLWSPFLLV